MLVSYLNGKMLIWRHKNVTGPSGYTAPVISARAASQSSVNIVIGFIVCTVYAIKP